MPKEIAFPGHDQRALICGKTGCGKTTLARVMMQSSPYAVIYDYKGLIDWPGYVRFTELQECINMAPKTPRIIYAPRHEELLNFELKNRFFQWVYLRGNCTLYVDEVYGVCERGEIPSFYHGILTRGREFNIRTISSTQRPKQIPQVVLSESEHYYIFQLMLPQDRQRVREIIPVSDLQLRNLRSHNFLYSSVDGATLGPLRLAV